MIGVGTGPVHVRFGSGSRTCLEPGGRTATGPMAGDDMREYVWNPEADGDFPGTAEKQNVKDRRCCHCGRWFGIQGHSGHEEHCEFAEMDYLQFDEEAGRMRAEVPLGSVFLEAE